MATVSVNLSATTILEHVNLKMQSGCKTALLTDVDCLCVNTPSWEVGLTCSLLIVDGVTNFQLDVYASHNVTGEDYTDTYFPVTYSELLERVRQVADLYMEAQ